MQDRHATVGGDPETDLDLAEVGAAVLRMTEPGLDDDAGDVEVPAERCDHRQRPERLVQCWVDRTETRAPIEGLSRPPPSFLLQGAQDFFDFSADPTDCHV